MYEEDAVISFATLLDIEGSTEEAILKLEQLNSVSSNWHLAKVTALRLAQLLLRLEELAPRVCQL